ncbi:MAG: hypothetical protein P0Y50_10295 [Candidatus Brevundimonas colombiensis]|uniref:Uncharacterized protein n=1 Tax=Candidatus Brevundimonas colombiensis TaxID=3121376 RepID=A0AAJ5X0P9_9CAUL|nr:hypothetical protein [Brevundimonas sp.]WEK38938.1 MAG: hypothetical protein P0Y50_10295 [Brevundimonas sp.]
MLAALAMTAGLMGEPEVRTARVAPDDLADMQCIVTLMEGIGEDEAKNLSILSTLSYFMGKLAGRAQVEPWNKVLVAYRAGLDQTARTKMFEDHGARCMAEGLAPAAIFLQLTMADTLAAIAASSD